MVRLSVNVNKVATLRNSRGGDYPRVQDAVEVCLKAGVGGITVHPRADERHITPQDVRDVAAMLGETTAPGVEYNIEGDLRPEWLELVHRVKPHQATLVPVREGEVTSEAGWGRDTDEARMRSVISELKSSGIRVSLFVDASVESVAWAGRMGADRVELFTEPFAAAFARGSHDGQRLFEVHGLAARAATDAGLGINAGHDLDLDNLPLYRGLPGLLEVSIGHALMGRALFVGLSTVVREYLEVLEH